MQEPNEPLSGGDRSPERPGTGRSGRLLFPAFVGLLFGAPIGGVCCRLMGLMDFVWEATLIGALTGSLGGVLLVGILRWARHTLEDVATVICVAFGLLPAVVVVLGGMGIVRGKFSALLLAGAASAGPMAGLLIGAMLDRAREAWLQRAWGPTIRSGVAAVAVCMGLVALITREPSGPDPAEVAAETRSRILWYWKITEKFPDATIQKVTLEKKARNLYVGFLDATIAGKAERFSLEVSYEDEIIHWSLKPIDD